MYTLPVGSFGESRTAAGNHYVLLAVDHVGRRRCCARKGQHRFPKQFPIPAVKSPQFLIVRRRTDEEQISSSDNRAAVVL